MTIEQEILQIVNQIIPTIEKAFTEVFIERHPGHPNQKVHGNRFGGYSATKESLRRLKGDKEARERYKQQARKRGESSVENRLAKHLATGKLENMTFQTWQKEVKPIGDKKWLDKEAARIKTESYFKHLLKAAKKS